MIFFIIAFPPLGDITDTSQANYPLEIRDPWSGPRAYAEDYYSGGDIRLQPDSQLNVDHLGPFDDEQVISTLDNTNSPHLSDHYEDGHSQDDDAHIPIDPICEEQMFVEAAG